MEKIFLLYDQQEELTVKDIILPGLSAYEVQLTPYKIKDPSCEAIPEGSHIITYINDASIVDVVKAATAKSWSLGFLPHPAMLEARHGYGISASIPEALEDIVLNTNPVKANILLCNGTPVMNRVVIGNSLSLMSGSVSKNTFQSKLEKFTNFFRQSKSLVPREFTVEAHNKPPVKTAALGIVAVLHGRSTLLSRNLLKGSHINDGKLHALILAPRSVMQLVKFSIKSLFEKANTRKLPSFIGHIKTGFVCISSPSPMDFSQDSNLLSATTIELEVSKNRISIIPGRHLQQVKDKKEPDEKFKINKLPKGENYIHELTSSTIPLIYHASTEDFKELFRVLRENAKATSSYLTLMVLSTLLATFGLYSNSSPVIIGAMILAPLMSPIVSLSMGVLRQERILSLKSLKTIGLGLLLGYLSAMLVTLLVPLQAVNEEITARIRPNLLDLGIAIVSGIAGAYAYAREEVAKTLAGVAIAVALVPPLAVSGIGLGWGEWDIFFGALLLLMTNLAGIVFAAAITFMLLGFSPLRLARKGLSIALLTVAVISLPLIYGSMTMIRENNVVQSLNNYKIGEVTIKQVNIVRSGDPMTLSVVLVSDETLDDADLEQVKHAIEQKIDRDIILEALVSLRR